MVPDEIFEMIGSNINLYKTCKAFYNHKSVFYKSFIIDMNTNYKYSITNNIPYELITYMKNNSYHIINFNQPNIELPKKLTH